MLLTILRFERCVFKDFFNKRNTLSHPKILITLKKYSFVAHKCITNTVLIYKKYTDYKRMGAKQKAHVSRA